MSSKYGNWGTRFGTHVPKKTITTRVTTVPPDDNKDEPLVHEVKLQSKEFVPYYGHVTVGMDTGKTVSYGAEKLNVYCEVCVVTASTEQQERDRAFHCAKDNVLMNLKESILAADQTFNYRNLYLQAFIKEQEND